MTNLDNRLAPLRPGALAGEQGAGGLRGPTARKAAWLLGCLAVWLFGCLVVWLFGCLVVWLFGCLAVWLLGCLALARWAALLCRRA